MYTCLYMFVCDWVFVSTCLCIYVCDCVHENTRVCVSRSLCVHIFLCLYPGLWTCVCVYLFTYVGFCVYISVCIAIFIFCMCMGVQVCSEARESYGDWPFLIYPMWILLIKLKKVLGLAIGTVPEPSHWLVSGSLCICIWGLWV